jgi:hypothetical protein
MEEHSFDALAKEMADGAISRGRALKLLGAALLGFGSLSLFGGVAETKRKKKHRHHHHSVTPLCSDGQTGCADGTCLCFLPGAGFGTCITTGNPRGICSFAPSDRNFKEGFATVDEREILARLVDMPVQSWNYKGEDPSIRHIGPMAQDFAAAFGVGEDDKYINLVDANGVTTAAIQALYRMVQEKEAQISALRAEVGALKEQRTDEDPAVGICQGSYPSLG